MPERQQNAPLKVLKLSGVILMITPFFYRVQHDRRLVEQ